MHKTGMTMMKFKFDSICALCERINCVCPDYEAVNPEGLFTRDVLEKVSDALVDFLYVDEMVSDDGIVEFDGNTFSSVRAVAQKACDEFWKQSTRWQKYSRPIVDVRIIVNTVYGAGEMSSHDFEGTVTQKTTCSIEWKINSFEK